MKKLWLRLGALSLAVILLISAVGALEFDLNQDGKTNVADLQILFDSGRGAESQIALQEALGGKGDELSQNAEGVYEIWSVMGLYNMVEHATEGAAFELKADIDLGGMNWTPVAKFKGTFDGGNHTISNFTITESTAGGNDGRNMGFFGLIDFAGKDAEGANIQSTVKNLNVQGVTITVPEDANLDIRWVGMIAGSNRGIIENCSAEGIIHDGRTSLANKSYFGTIAGRNNDSNPPGKITGSNNMLVKDTATTYTHTQLVNSMMALDFADLQAGSEARKVGIAGYSKTANIEDSLLWQDLSNSTELVSETLQQRRQTVVDYMYEMCTVKWTPSQDMKLTVYKKTQNVSNSEYKVGQIYYGIPYNHGSSGMDRFVANMDVKDGVYTTKASLPTTAYYVTDSNVVKILSSGTVGQTVSGTNWAGKKVTLVVPEGWDNTKTSGTFVTGFAQQIGNDCSSAASWAWRQVSAMSGTDFAYLLSTSSMIPTENYINNAGNTKNGYMKSYGLVPVNGLSFQHPRKDMDDDGVVDIEMDLSGDGEVTSDDYADMVEAVFQADKTYYLETLAAASRGDIIVGYNDAGGHTRLLAGDAVAIRNWNGVIQPTLSYMVTHEQGRSSSGTTNGESWKSSCTVNCKYTFDQLTNYADYEGIGSACCYFPVTCVALQEENTPAATATCELTSGKITSNFHIVSTTVGEETVYTNCTQSGSRNRCVELTVTKVHPNVQTGDTVKVLLSNGQTCEFTY